MPVTTTPVLEKHRYTPLAEGWIRLLQLSPSRDAGAPVRCQILDYCLLDEELGSHPYEALSYVWGSPENPISIAVGDGEPAATVSVTRNLYAALRRLRHRSLARVLWVDSVCINQHDDEEKRLQVQSMAKIYASAMRVIVWIEETLDIGLPGGELATTDGDAALEVILRASSRLSPDDANDRETVVTLLGRSWFQRIWVLQETAAARHLVIASRSNEIDGSAFSVGIERVLLDTAPVNKSDDEQIVDDEDDSQEQKHWRADDTSDDESIGAAPTGPELERRDNCEGTDKAHFPRPPGVTNTARSATYLMKAAFNRPRRLPVNNTSPFSLKILPLATLIDMYHSRLATDQRDRVFALLGMCCDQLPADLLPDYNISWEILFIRLINLIVPASSDVRICRGGEIAIFQATGWAAGIVSEVRDGVHKNASWDTINIGIERHATEQGCRSFSSLRLHSHYRHRKRPNYLGEVRAAPGLIAVGDVIWMFHDEAAPAVLRFCGDFWIVVLIGTEITVVTTATKVNREPLLSVQPRSLHNVQLVWDWGHRLDAGSEPRSFRQFVQHRQLVGKDYASNEHVRGDNAHSHTITASMEMALLLAGLGLEEESLKLCKQSAMLLPPENPESTDVLLFLDLAKKLASLMHSRRGGRGEVVDTIADIIGRRGAFKWICEWSIIQATRVDIKSLHVLLYWRKAETTGKITEAVLRDSFWYLDGFHAAYDARRLKLLLNHSPEAKRNVTVDVIVAAALTQARSATLPDRDHTYGKAIANFMALLLDEFDAFQSHPHIPDAVVEATARGYPSCMKLLLDRYGCSIKINDAVVKAVRSRPMMELLLRCREDEVKITQDVVLRVMAERQHQYPPDDYLDFLMSRYFDLNNGIVPEWAVAAVATVRAGQTLVPFLEQYSDRIEVPHRLLEEIPLDSEAIGCIINKSPDSVKITEKAVENAARYGGMEELQLLLRHARDLQGHEFRITENIVKAVARNHSYYMAMDMMALVLKEGGPDCQITDAVVEAAAADGSPLMLSFLLNQRGDGFRINEGTLLAAIRNPKDSGFLNVSMGDSLLDKCMRQPDNVITERVVLELARTGHHRSLGRLLSVGGVNMAPEATEKMLEVAAQGETDGDTVRAILAWFKPGMKITEKALESAIRSDDRCTWILRLFLDQGEVELEMTPRVLQTAVSQQDRAYEMTEWLVFHGQFKPALINAGVLKATMENPIFGTWILSLLLEEDVDVAEVTQEVLAVAVADELYGLDIVTQLVDKFGRRLLFSKDVLDLAAGNNKYSVRMLEKIKECFPSRAGLRSNTW